MRTLPPRQRFALLCGALLALLLLVAAGFWWSDAFGPREVRRTDLILRDGILYRQGGHVPFRGLLVENYPSGARKSAIEISHGKAHGLSRGWFQNGGPDVEEHFVRGVSEGVRTRWHINGQKRSEASIVHGQLAGPYAEWHDNGQLAVRMNFLDGKGDGLAEAWHRSGAPKSRTRLEHGEVRGQETFADPKIAAASPPQP